MKYENPLQLKQSLANYGVANGFQMWYMRNDFKCLLVYCGRDIAIGRCASKIKLKGVHLTSTGPSENEKTPSKGKGKGIADNEKTPTKGKGKGIADESQPEEAVLESNPRSTCHLDVEDDEGIAYFKRFYVCFKGLKDGWNAGCRRVIGIDGCSYPYLQGRASNCHGTGCE
ncbi:hypothetical protein Tco_1522217 [Tanacetum coccineum]